MKEYRVFFFIFPSFLGGLGVAQEYFRQQSGDSSPKNENSDQTCMNTFLLLNTKEDILNQTVDVHH